MLKNKSVTLFLLLLALSLALVACGGDSTDEPAAEATAETVVDDVVTEAEDMVDEMMPRHPALAHPPRQPGGDRRLPVGQRRH